MQKIILTVLILFLAGTLPVWADGKNQDHWAAASIFTLRSHGYSNLPSTLNSVVIDDQWEKMVFEVYVTKVKDKEPNYQYWIKVYTQLNNGGNTKREWAVGGLMKLLNMAGKVPGSYAAEENYLQGFSDVSEISEHNLALWQGAAKIGLITGYPDGTLRPQNDLTFAEGAALLAKAHRILYEDKEN